MTQARKTALLIFLLFLWVGVFIYQYSQPVQKHQPLKFKKGDVFQIPEKGGKPLESSVRLDLLQTSKTNLKITKNIFAPIHIDLPPPKKVEPPPPPPVVLPPPPSPEEIARTHAMQSLSEFKYLGYLNKGRGKEQGFFSRSGELFIVTKGEAIVGSFILKDLDPNQAVLRDKVTGVESTLVLSN